MPGSIRSSTTRSARVARASSQRGLAVAGLVDVVAGRPQVGHHHLAHGVVVVDDEHAGHQPHLRSVVRRRAGAATTTTATTSAAKPSHSRRRGGPAGSGCPARAPNRPSTGTASRVTEPSTTKPADRRGAAPRRQPREHQERRAARPAGARTASWSTTPPASQTARSDAGRTGRCRAEPDADQHQHDAGGAEQPAEHAHHATSIRATHLVCSTPGRFGAISRHG